MNSLLAYLDPGTGSLILQALVGGFSGLVVLGRYLWIQLHATRSTSSEPLLAAELEAFRGSADV